MRYFEVRKTAIYIYVDIVANRLYCLDHAMRIISRLSLS